MRQRRRHLILTLVAALAVTGCAGESNSDLPPPQTPLETASPTGGSSEDESPSVDGSGASEATETPTPEPLPLPDYPADLTAEDTAENAVIAAEYFLDLMNYIQSTGDVAVFEEVSADSCQSCRRFIDNTDEIYAQGGFSVGNYAEMRSPIASKTEDDLAWVVVADWTIGTGQRVLGGEEGYVDIPGNFLENHRLGVQLIEGEWKMLTFAMGVG